MSVTYKKNRAVLADIVTVEDAEGLLEWLLKKPDAQIDLSRCTHLHPANLQVLMAAGSKVTAWPGTANLHSWLRNALRTQ